MTGAILADDLTGACDAAAPFAARGMATEVRLDATPGWPNGVAVLALDTDTRRLSRRTARARANRAARVLRDDGAGWVYKKIDSTLRGHVAAELLVCLRAWEAPLAVLCPAFPALGRQVSGGHLVVSGKTIGPVADLAGFSGGMRVTTMSISQVEAGPEGIAVALQKLSGSGTEVVIADATTSGDLAALAEAATKVEPRPLLAGSAGLAGALASVLRSPTSRVATEKLTRGPGSHGAPWLIVAGSQTEVTAAQVEELKRAGAAVTALNADDLLGRREYAEAAGRRAAQTLEAGRTTVLRLLVSSPSYAGGRVEDRAARALGRACRAVVERAPPDGLLLTGGLTARGSLLALGAQGLRLESEPLPGIAQGRALGGIWDGRPVITKAGGFGKADAMRRLTASRGPLGG